MFAGLKIYMFCICKCQPYNMLASLDVKKILFLLLARVHSLYTQFFISCATVVTAPHRPLAHMRFWKQAEILECTESEPMPYGRDSRQ